MTPFAIRNLSVLAYAQGFTLWHYRHAGSAADLQTPGFFADAADMFAAGDILLASTPGGAQALFVSRADHSVETTPLAATPDRARAA